MHPISAQYTNGRPPQPQISFALATRLVKSHLGIPSFPHKRPSGGPSVILFRIYLAYKLLPNRVSAASPTPPPISPNNDPAMQFTPGLPRLRNLPRSLGDCKFWYSGRKGCHSSA